MAKQLENTQRSHLVAFAAKKFSNKAIAQDLDVSPFTASRVLAKHKIYNTFDYLKGNGGPSVISSGVVAFIYQGIKKPKESLRKLQASIEKSLGK